MIVLGYASALNARIVTSRIDQQMRSFLIDTLFIETKRILLKTPKNGKIVEFSNLDVSSRPSCVLYVPYSRRARRLLCTNYSTLPWHLNVNGKRRRLVMTSRNGDQCNTTRGPFWTYLLFASDERSLRTAAFQFPPSARIRKYHQTQNTGSRFAEG